MNSNQNLAWHYTTGEKFNLIIKSGYLDPEKTATPPNESPILWFSKNQYFESTAQKAALTKDGEVEPLGMMGTCKNCNGLVRFGYPAVMLTGYKNLCEQAGMTMFSLMELERVGVLQGAKPSDWLGSLNRIKVTDCIIEFFNGITWVRVNHEWKDG